MRWWQSPIKRIFLYKRSLVLSTVIGFVLLAVLVKKIFLPYPLVSVIVPCYNCRADWLNASLQSIRSNKSLKPESIQIILVDDGVSTKLPADRLYKVQQLGGDGRNRGLAVARNTGAAMARGKFLLFLDPDDIIEADAIEKLLIGYFSNHQVDPRIAFTYPEVKHFWENGRPTTIESFSFRSDLMLKKNHLTSFALIPRELYWAVGGMSEQIRWFEDYDFWLRLIGLKLKGALIKEPLFTYRRHENGKSSQIQKAKIEFMDELYRCNPVTFGKVYLESIDIGSLDYFPCLQPNNLYHALQRFMARIRRYWGISTPLPTILFSLSELLTHAAHIKDDGDAKTGVALIVPWLSVGGADYYDLEVVRALATLGSFRIIVITEMKVDKGASLVNLFQPLAEIFCLETIVPAHSTGNISAQIVDYLLQSRKISIIYVRNSMVGYETVSRWQKKIYSLDVQHLWTPENRLGWEYTSLVYNDYLDRRIVISDSLRQVQQEIIQKKLGSTAKQDHIMVVFPAVNVTTIMENKDNLPRCSNLTLMFIGRLVEQKDPILWIRIAQELALVHENLLFLMIGDGYLGDQVNYEISQAASLKDRILRLPFLTREEVTNCLIGGIFRDRFGVLRLGSVDRCVSQTILLNTSQNEGIPLTMLEAAALKVPLVAPNIGALAELQKELGQDYLRLSQDRSIASFKKVIEQVLDTVHLSITPDVYISPKFQIETFRQRIIAEFSRLIDSGQS